MDYLVKATSLAIWLVIIWWFAPKTAIFILKVIAIIPFLVIWSIGFFILLDLNIFYAIILVFVTIILCYKLYTGYIKNRNLRNSSDD